MYTDLPELLREILPEGLGSAAFAVKCEEYKACLVFLLWYNLGLSLYAGIQATGSEMFAANRDLSMLQHLLEHILFLYTGFWGLDLHFSLHPCNRVFPEDSKKVDEYKRLGSSSPRAKV